MKFGFGQPLTAQGRRRAAARRRALRRRRRAGRARCMRWCCARRMRMRASASHDLDRVRAMPGVRLVLTGADVADLGPTADAGVHAGRATIEVPPYPILARDVVRHVGDAIAFVVADTLGGGKGRRRGDRGRLAAAAACDRRHGRARSPARRWSGRPAGQSRLRDRGRRRSRDQGGLRAGRAHGRR